MFKQLILVGLGGGIGSILRYLTSVFTARYYNNAFPLATFVINIIGCFAIGLLLGFFSRNADSGNLRLLFITGFCGGYTTFSAFAAENMLLIQQQNYLTMLAYVFSSVIIGLFAVGLGLLLSRAF